MIERRRLSGALERVLRCVRKLLGGMVIAVHHFTRTVSVSDGRTSGSYALVIFTDKREVLVYSLPGLDFLHTLPLPVASSM